MFDRNEPIDLSRAVEGNDRDVRLKAQQEQYKPGGVTWQLTHMQDEVRELEQLWEVLRKRVDPFVDNESPVPSLDENKPEPASSSGVSQELYAIRSRVRDLSYQMSRLIGSIDL